MAHVLKGRGRGECEGEGSKWRILIVEKTIILEVIWGPLLLKKGKIRETIYRKARLNNMHNLGG
jgi:hypothetical protein